MLPHLWLEQAQERIATHIRKTALTYDEPNGLYLKWENQQVTGSFKARGAINKLLSLQPWERERGIVSASAGNHGQGLALAGKLTGTPVIVFASEHAVPAKLQAMRDLGAELHLVPGGYGEAERAGLEFAQSRGVTWVSAYNDGQVIAGQGSLALEILQEMPALGSAAWIVPVGGGGLIAGIGAGLKSMRPSVAARLVGVQSEASPFMHDLYHHGTQENTVEDPSLADGLAGPVEPGSLTIPLVRELVDDLILVSEQEIGHAIRYAWQRYNERIEGSSAAALAAVINGRISQRPAVVIISGGNIQPEIHRSILDGETWKS